MIDTVESGTIFLSGLLMVHRSPISLYGLYDACVQRLQQYVLLSPKGYDTPGSAVRGFVARIGSLI